MSHSTDPLNILQSIISIILLIFSTVLVMALIFEQKTSLSEEGHESVAFILFWLSLLWLSVVEGGQASMVGLPPVDRKLFEKTHRITHAICEYGHRGDNLNRYLLGRQFMVLVLVFVINRSGAPVAGAEVLGMPQVITDIFLVSGIAMILITCMMGQLNSQVNATVCMLDYANNYFMTFTLYVAMGIEASGLLHASYLIQMIVAKIGGKEIPSDEPPRSGFTLVLFWARVLMSLTILVISFVYTIGALFLYKTTMWGGIPPYVSVILFFLLMGVVGMLEAMQIVFFSSAKLTKEEREKTFWTRKVCGLVFHGHNFSGFMVGRQLLVVACFFFIARCTTMEIEEGENNVMGVSNTMQEFFNTGLLGALITTIVASIAWQLVATAFPMIFLNNPLTYLLLCICLSLQATGICNGAWVIARIHKTIVGWKIDEEYIGTPEERRSKVQNVAL